jgi:bifunctional non-homologous end joining protein LigD
MPERRRSRARYTRPLHAPAAPPLDAIVTNPAKALWPDEGYTKLDLIRYYQAVVPVLLPHLRDRPLVMKPYPAGITGRFYYRQTLPKTAPDWMPRWEHVPRAGAEPNQMPLAQDEAALTWLANQAAIEMHPWLSRIDAPDEPDYVVFDLDILDPDLFPLALEAALHVRDAAARHGLACHAKTSGGDGVHVYIPIRRGPPFERTRVWALELAESLRAARPALFATESRIAGRERRVLIDYAQNALGKTTVAVYSARGRPGATVSTPLAWDEVEAGRLRPADFTIESVPARIAERGDLFAPVLNGTASLPP